jgi:adenylate kinase
MDGYPRTLAQAAAFDLVLRQQFLDLTAAVLLRVSDEAIVERAKNRWSCPKPGCKATYNTHSNPARVLGICDRCGTRLVQREDDQEETVRRRLAVYHQNTEELIPHYRAQGSLREVAGEGEIEQIYQNILKAVNAQVSPPC